ncbi:MAG: antitoxin Xre-like helix-turn-helix domain-containing protein [Terracidiphilus sp.]|jgi:putative toxin-antitoxin system antitoxin component (TIGR02293 family)
MSHASAVVVPVEPVRLDFEAVKRGVPIAALEEFSACSGIPLKELLGVVIPARTLKHRRERKEPLSLDESDRLARVARFYELAVRVFGNATGGREWLTFPIDRFEGKTALEMLRTDTGARQVEEMLYQIDEGVFA